MRTSAAGRPERQSGFTLVELLVVLTMIGLLSAVVVLAIPDGRGGLAGEAERFAARAKAARDKAIVGARPVAIAVSAAGYSFEQREQGQWRPLRQKPFIEQRWNEGTSAALAGAGTARIAFDSTGSTEPFQLTLERKDERVLVEVQSAGIRVVR